ncbi:MAG: 3'(2'),5'-bisphosphate nucleotidase CysQ [Pseudomonadota bacterium]|nr:3'(2'),5'-bisphosphate nucleotidase CysQ [Pseudomonadota bacterium]MDE3036849.1 3'(2'),5'-bisphosphate nucleotidase CysQ [Pseudomonadota bacterium]
MNSISFEEYLEPVCAIAEDAGRLIMRYFSGTFGTRRKDDESPVTDADIAANEFIVKALLRLTPGIPAVAEESDSHAEAHLREGGFWLVDPLDGTRSFVRGETEFTVNIGLVRDGCPLLGVIYAPPQETLYWSAKEQGAFRRVKGGAAERIHTRKPPADGLVVVRSRSHPSAKTSVYLETLNIKEQLGKSSAIKFCMVAEGSADIYPRFGRTMEWDTAAGQAIVEAAGGRVETEGGQPFTYGKPGFENPAFIVYGQ